MQQSMIRFTSHTGLVLDAVAFGTFLITPGEDTYRAVSLALEAGYRSIDTAKYYDNERDVARAVHDAGLANKVQITTKLWNDEQGREKTLHAVERSREYLKVESIDLLLIHWPKPLSVETWETFEELQSNGVIQHIGVSNFEPEHIQTLIDRGLKVPASNQVELSPLLSQKHIREYCATHNIIVEGWRTLMGGALDKVSSIKNIADTHGKTIAQIVLRWAIQDNVRVLPKSVHQERMKANLDIFDFSLTDHEMNTIDNLDKQYRTGPNPKKLFSE